MRWDEVAVAIAAEAVADPTLAAIYGADVRMGALAQDHHVPSLEYQIIGDTATELWEPTLIQWDQWTNTFDELVRSERALRKLFDKDHMVEIGGVTMWTVFTDGASLVDSPDRAGFYGRAVTFRMTPVRDDLRWGRSS
jgi:hypothetical protein